MVLVASFFLTFFNRFAGLRSGDGEYSGGFAFLAGRLPYRDYFTTAPPLNVLKSALLLKMFGSALIVSRFAGVAERLLIGIVLLRWLKQIFRPIPALIAAVVTMIVSAGDRTDPIASYNHDAIFWAMLSGLVASYSLARDQSGWRWFGTALLSGILVAMSLLTKQTVGLGAVCTVLIVMAILVYKARGHQQALAWTTSYLFGCALPIGIIAGVLWRFHLLSDALLMLFIQGPAAKATHSSDFLVREFQVAWDNFGWLVLGSFALTLAWQPIIRFTLRTRTEQSASPSQLRQSFGVLLAGAGVFVVAHLLRNMPSLHDFSKSSVYFSLLGLTFLMARALGLLCRGPLQSKQAHSVLFCAVSFSVALTLSLSWPAFEAMVLPGLGYLLASTMEGVRERSLPFVYGSMCFLTLIQFREKLDLPFGFDYQDEAAVRRATQSSRQPQLQGMLLPRQTVRFLDETSAIIQQNASDNDTIFVYPEMSLLYALSSRSFPTQSGSHNIDVVNDTLAKMEAERLKQARPAVIIYYRKTEQQERDAERLWREGKPSGQRLLVSTIEALITTYRLAGSYRLLPKDPEILVYVRR